jgi:hypothetical protein
VAYPADLPPGLPHASPGAEPHSARIDSVEGCPWAAAWSGSARPTGCHTGPTCKICNVIDDPRALLESLVEKHLTQNQMFGSRQAASRRPRPKKHPYLHQLVHHGYGRPWIPLDVNPKMRHVHGQFAGSGGVLLATTDLMA